MWFGESCHKETVSCHKMLHSFTSDICNSTKTCGLLLVLRSSWRSDSITWSLLNLDLSLTDPATYFLSFTQKNGGGGWGWEQSLKRKKIWQQTLTSVIRFPYAYNFSSSANQKRKQSSLGYTRAVPLLDKSIVIRVKTRLLNTDKRSQKVKL